VAGLCALPTQPGHAQSRPFQPGENPVSNQAWNSIAVGSLPYVPTSPTRAVYNGAAAACNIVIIPNGSSSAVTFQNVQPGEFLPVQATQITAASTCTNMVALF